MTRYLFLAGALPYLILGTAHAFATPLRPGDARGLSPRDPELAGRMAQSAVRITRRTNLWLAWVGFNLSHSLGVVLFGLFVVAIGRSDESFAAQAALCVPLATVVAAAYLYLATQYWFRTPILGCAFALLAFAGSWTLWLLGVR
jgi:hypothetical protein